LRAAQFSSFGGPEVLEVVDVPEPHPGPGQIRIAVRAAGINPVDWKFRQGMMGGELPSGTGREAAGVVDALGEGVTGASIGDAVFGHAADGAAQFAVLTNWAVIPAGLDFPGAAGLPVAVETAVRGLDQLGVTRGSTLLVDGAAGGVGSAVVQIARERGARVIGTASEPNHEYLRSLGAEPVTYGDGLAQRVRELAPGGVDAAFDVAGGGQLPALIELAGGADRVLTIADFAGAQEHGVRFSGGPGTEQAYDAIREIGSAIEAGQFSLPVSRTFPLDEIAEAHRVSEGGHARGKLVLVVD
jgi:NADPH:quinone reductase-like Zn-dependent oxidoreductase